LSNRELASVSTNQNYNVTLAKKHNELSKGDLSYTDQVEG